MAIQRQRTLTLDLTGKDTDPGRVVQEMQGMVHPLAAAEMERRNGKSGVDHAVEWVRRRWQMLAVKPDDAVRLSLNAYSDGGLGLQSVRVGVLRGDQSVRLADEVNDPTIGVITEGLVDGHDVRWAVVGFQPDFGEELTPLSGHLLMDGVSDSSRIRFATSDQPQLLAPGSRITVCHPDQVRTIVQKAGVDIQDPANAQDFVHRGMYACRYVRKSAAV